MNLHSAAPLTKQYPRRRISKIAPFITLSIILTFIPLYHPSIHYSTNKLISDLSSPSYHPSHQESIGRTALSKIRDISSHYSDDSDPNLIIQEHDTEKRNPSNGNCDLAAVTKIDKGEKTPRKIVKRLPSDKVAPQKYVTGQNSGHGHGDVKIIRRPYNDDIKECDLFSGEWVPNPMGPYYTNTTCWAIQEHQNCMRFGRPDTGFMKWRWKPNGCELPVFDPLQFLDHMRGKSLAFVGDSVARNHMHSLICLLSRVTYPVDVSNTTDENFKHWEYKDFNFNLSIFWSPYLVKTQKTDPNDITRPFNLYLDEFDESWTTQIEKFDHVIISAGQWFFRPTMFYVKRRLIGCLYCPNSNVTHRTSQFSYRRAFRTAFRAINSLRNYKGITFLRTIATSHFENGPWDKGGNCVRTRPFRSGEIVLEDYNLEMYKIQLEEFKIGGKIGRKKGLKFRLIDMTQAMLLRPDGHPGKYGHWPPAADASVISDCVHWCLPGPIDTWNDFLLEMLKRERERERERC